MCFPCGNPFVLPATGCTLNYKRTLLLVEGKTLALVAARVWVLNETLDGTLEIAAKN